MNRTRLARRIATAVAALAISFTAAAVPRAHADWWIKKTPVHTAPAPAHVSTAAKVAPAHDWWI